MQCQDELEAVSDSEEEDAEGSPPSCIGSPLQVRMVELLHDSVPPAVTCLICQLVGGWTVVFPAV